MTLTEEEQYSDDDNYQWSKDSDIDSYLSWEEDRLRLRRRLGLEHRPRHEIVSEEKTWKTPRDKYGREPGGRYRVRNKKSTKKENRSPHRKKQRRKTVRCNHEEPARNGTDTSRR